MYGIKFVNQSEVTTFDPAVDSPMTYVATYTVPSYSAPGNASVTVPGIRNDNHWFIVTTNSPSLYTTFTITNDTFTTSTVSPATGTIASFTIDVYRNNSTTVPTSNYGFWMLNDLGYVSAQTDYTSWLVYSDPTVVSNGSTLPTIPSGFFYAARPTSATGYLNFSGSITSPTVSSSTLSNIEYIAIGPASLLTPTSSGYGLQIFNSSGQLMFDGSYRQVISVNIQNFSSSSITSWSLGIKSPYLLLSETGFRRNGIQQVSPSSGVFTATVPTWTSITSGSSANIVRSGGGPPTNSGPFGSSLHTFFQISG